MSIRGNYEAPESANSCMKEVQEKDSTVFGLTLSTHTFLKAMENELSMIGEIFNLCGFIDNKGLHTGEEKGIAHPEAPNNFAELVTRSRMKAEENLDRLGRYRELLAKELGVNR